MSISRSDGWFVLVVVALCLLFGWYYAHRYNRVYDACLAAGNADWYCEAMARAPAR